MNSVRVPLAELVEDYSIYPRARVDSTNVRKLRDALEAGEALPPILIDAASRRIVDGFHRVKASRLFFGLNGDIDAIEKSYESDAELLKDAVRLNAAHGRGLSPYDCARSIVLGEQAGVPMADIAECLHVTMERANEIKARKVSVVMEQKEMRPIVIKCTMSHMAGRELSKAQADAIPHLGGMRQTFYVNQLITIVESNLLDGANPLLMERLAHLNGLLNALFAEGGESLAA